jgi:tyrosyl-tRNA synthetase
MTPGTPVTDGAMGQPVTIEGPTARVTVKAPVGGLSTVADLMAGTGIVASKSEARRVIAAGGAYLNNRKVTSPDAVVDATNLLHGRFLVLRRGRRTIAGAEVASS